MRFSLYALVVAGFTCTVIAGESVVEYRNRPLTIDDAVQLSLKQNPSILAQIQQLKVQKGLVFQAQAELLPQLTAASNYSQNANELSAGNEFIEARSSCRARRPNSCIWPGREYIHGPCDDDALVKPDLAGYPDCLPTYLGRRCNDRVSPGGAHQ